MADRIGVGSDEDGVGGFGFAGRALDRNDDNEFVLLEVPEFLAAK